MSPFVTRIDQGNPESNSNIITQEINSMAKLWMWGYKKCIHSTHVWIHYNASNHYMMVIEILAETEWFQQLSQFHDLPTRNYCSLIISYHSLLCLYPYFCVWWLTVVSGLQEDYGEIWKKLIHFIYRSSMLNRAYQLFILEYEITRITKNYPMT